MPFKKEGKNKYVSPSGRRWNLESIRAYYANLKAKGKVKKK